MQLFILDKNQEEKTIMQINANTGASYIKLYICMCKDQIERFL